jgi:hypothetical protein
MCSTSFKYAPLLEMEEEINIASYKNVDSTRVRMPPYHPAFTQP